MPCPGVRTSAAPPAIRRPARGSRTGRASRRSPSCRRPATSRGTLDGRTAAFRPGRPRGSPGRTRSRSRRRRRCELVWSSRELPCASPIRSDPSHENVSDLETILSPTCSQNRHVAISSLGVASALSGEKRCDLVPDQTDQGREAHAAVHGSIVTLPQGSVEGPTAERSTLRRVDRTASGGGRDVLIDVEQVVGVVLGLHLGQAVVVVAVRRPDAVTTFALTEEVHVGAAGRERMDVLVVVDRPVPHETRVGRIVVDTGESARQYHWSPGG
jgi:hypothetical protein